MPYPVNPNLRPLSTGQIGYGGTGGPAQQSNAGMGYWHPPGWVDPNAAQAQMPNVAPPGTLTTPSPVTTQLPDALNTANAINQGNLNFVRGGQQTDPTWQMIQNLLNPNWGPQVYDSAEANAENAVGMGIQGSNLANFRGARQYANDLKGNATLASQLLTGATGRLPTPFDTGSQLISPLQQSQLAQQQQQLTQQAQLQREAQAAENYRAQLAAQARYAHGEGAGGYRGGAGRGASVADASAGVPPLSTFNQTNAGPGTYYPSGNGESYPYGQDYGYYDLNSQSYMPGSIEYGSDALGQDTGMYNQNDQWSPGSDWQNNGNEEDWWNQPLTIDNFENLYQ